MHVGRTTFGRRRTSHGLQCEDRTIYWRTEVHSSGDLEHLSSGCCSSEGISTVAVLEKKNITGENAYYEQSNFVRNFSLVSVNFI